MALLTTGITFCMVILCSVLVQRGNAECGVSGCSRHGYCIRSTYVETCVCHHGWTGEDCSIDIDECALDICGSHGSCSNTQGGFICNCNVGYSGSRCQFTEKRLRSIIRRLFTFPTPPPPPTTTTGSIGTTASPPPLPDRTPPTPPAINTPKPITEHFFTTNSPPPITSSIMAPVVGK